MEENEVTGVVLSTMAFKEKDKLLHVFTIELGNITCLLKGVSSSNAKLKPISQPFCFAKLELTKSNDFYIIRGAVVIDSFFDITLDYDRFIHCSSLLEVCRTILRPNIISEGLFLALIKTFQNIVYNGINYKLACIKFLLLALKLIGYELNFDTCDNCDLKFMGNIKFNIESGTFRCSNCSGGLIIEKAVFANLKIINTTPIERLQTIKVKDEILDECLKILYRDIEYRLNYKIKSINLN